MHAQEEKKVRHRDNLEGKRGCLMTSKRRDGHGYRRDDKEFAAHEVEQAHGSSAVGVGQQGAVMAPCHLSPLGVWVLWHCGRRIKKRRLESSYKQRENSKRFEELRISY